MKREKVSATVLTFNEESNIRECLESVSWADEIVVIDSGSSDKTIKIAKQYTDKVLVNPWPGFKGQKNFAVDNASHDWIFNIDADERVPDPLKNKILELLSNPEIDGYSFPRRNYFLGKWMRYGGWYPDYVLRLFNKNRGRFGGIDPHACVVLDSGKTKRINEPITHITYKSLNQYLDKQNFYSTTAAQVKYESRKHRSVSVLTIVVKTIWKFFEVYFLKFGILDGSRGFIAACGSTALTFWKYAKIWEQGLKKNIND